MAHRIPKMKHGDGSIMLWVLLSGRDRKTVQNSELNAARYREVLEENLLKRAHDVRLVWRFSTTMTQSIQPGQHWCGFGTNLWMPLNGPAKAQRTSVERLKDAVHRCSPSNLLEEEETAFICHIYIEVQWNPFLRTSQLVRKLRSEHRVSRDAVPLEHRGLRAWLKGPTVTQSLNHCPESLRWSARKFQVIGFAAKVLLQSSKRVQGIWIFVSWNEISVFAFK